ncbi:FeS-binding protein [Candidatus Poribacteria bacterium]|nr:FeS-binding protein [Candidatus Poribacteria bacterium]
MTSQRVRLTFPPEQVTEPVIYNVGHKFRIVTNIRRASVTKDAGWVVLEMSGEPDELERALEYLRHTGVQVEPVDGDVVVH